MGNGGRVQGTLVMRTPLSLALGIVALLAFSGPARPSYAQPQENSSPAPARAAKHTSPSTSTTISTALLLVPSRKQALRPAVHRLRYFGRNFARAALSTFYRPRAAGRQGRGEGNHGDQPAAFLRIGQAPDRRHRANARQKRIQSQRLPILGNRPVNRRFRCCQAPPLAQLVPGQPISRFSRRL